MTEPMQQQDTESDPKAKLRQEYLTLLSDNFLDLPYTLAYGAADQRLQDSLLPTADEHKLIVNFYREGTLPGAQASGH